MAKTLLQGPESPILQAGGAASCRRSRRRAPSPRRRRRGSSELATSKDINVPMTRALDGGLGRAEIEIQGTKLDAEGRRVERLGAADVQGQRARERPRHDPVPPASARTASCRSTPRPVNMDPRNPPIPISKPDDFSAQLAKQIGLYRTLGWAESADKALQRGPARRGRVPLRLRAGVRRPRAASSSRAWRRDDWDLFVAAIETTDRVSHMMWRLIDPKHPMYDEGAGGEVRRRDREGLPARGRPRRAGSRRSCRRTRSSS